MTIEELEQWQEDFEQFHARFADLFERSESREQEKPVSAWTPSTGGPQE
jgi:hypothetical protein